MLLVIEISVGAGDFAEGGDEDPRPRPDRTTGVAVTQCLEIAAVCFFDADGALLTVRKRATQVFMLPGGKLESTESPHTSVSCDSVRSRPFSEV